MVDLDAVGGAATGGLIASTFEKPTGKAGEHHDICADCGTQTIGRFCHNCGNASHIHRTLAHLFEELLHGVMHFDSRVWRTIPLLAFRPGRLTREWVHGKRTRYVSPLAIFLFTVFVMFMGLSFLPGEPVESVADRQISAAARLSAKANEVAEAKRALERASPQDRADAEEELAEAQAELKALNERVQKLRAGEKPDAKGDVQAELKAAGLDLATGDKSIDAKIKKKLENPELAVYKLQQAFYKFSFLLVPISIPFVALLFVWKRGFTLYDHGVFVLYSLTFMSMLVMVTAIATRIGGMTAALTWMVVPFAIPVHMFYQLKGAYELRVFSALWRTWFLLWFCAIALGLFISAVVILSA